jgi:hypothetical protein
VIIINSISLKDYFNIKCDKLSCSKTTATYISNTLHAYKDSVYEFQNKSLTLEFAEAKFEMSYKRFNDLGDYILFMESTFPGALSSKGATREYYWSLAQSSYLRCWSFVREWKLYEELADMLPEIIIQLSDLQ